MDGMIVEANSTNHNGWSYIVRVMKIGRIIRCNTRHIDTDIGGAVPLGADKESDWIHKTNIAEVSFVEHNMILNPYAAGTQVQMSHSDRWVENTPAQQNQGTDAGMDMLHSSQD